MKRSSPGTAGLLLTIEPAAAATGSLNGKPFNVAVICIPLSIQSLHTFCSRLCPADPRIPSPEPPATTAAQEEGYPQQGEQERGWERRCPCTSACMHGWVLVGKGRYVSLKVNAGTQKKQVTLLAAAVCTESYVPHSNTAAVSPQIRRSYVPRAAVARPLYALKLQLGSCSLVAASTSPNVVCKRTTRSSTDYF